MSEEELDDDDCDYLFKAVLIGDSAVGKSNLLARFAGKEFSFDSKPTIGVEFACRNFKLASKSIKAQIWDTAGQERFRAITSLYYRGALGALLIYDITKRSTFLNLQTWLAEIRKFNSSDTVVVLIGNKTDLKHKREVDQEEGRDLAEKEGLCFLETSALTNSNVEDAFLLMFGRIHDTISKKVLGKNVEEVTIPPINRSLVVVDGFGEVSAIQKQGRCCSYS